MTLTGTKKLVSFPQALVSAYVILLVMGLSAGALSADEYSELIGNDLAGIETSAGALDVDVVGDIGRFAPTTGNSSLTRAGTTSLQIIQQGNYNFALQRVLSVDSRAYTGQYGNNNRAASSLVESNGSFAGQLQVGNNNTARLDVVGSPGVSVLNVQLGDNISQPLVIMARPGTELVIIRRPSK